MLKHSSLLSVVFCVIYQEIIRGHSSYKCGLNQTCMTVICTKFVCKDYFEWFLFNSPCSKYVKCVFIYLSPLTTTSAYNMFLCHSMGALKMAVEHF